MQSQDGCKHHRGNRDQRDRYGIPGYEQERRDRGKDETTGPQRRREQRPARRHDRGDLVALRLIDEVVVGVAEHFWVGRPKYVAARHLPEQDRWDLVARVKPRGCNDHRMLLSRAARAAALYWSLGTAIRFGTRHRRWARAC